jgi:2-oxoglutarate dehydrogenase complex dehydrogenase (E1) component-like enzyme
LDKKIIDWASAESLAIGSLLNEGYNVRLSGEDVTRGTFSQRHIGFYDQVSNEVFIPYNNNKRLFPGRLSVNNSILSEFAQMLFDYGYSLENPKNLVIWEAQFGDFFNGAQVTINLTRSQLTSSSHLEKLNGSDNQALSYSYLMVMMEQDLSTQIADWKGSFRTL